MLRLKTATQPSETQAFKYDVPEQIGTFLTFNVKRGYAHSIAYMEASAPVIELERQFMAIRPTPKQIEDLEAKAKAAEGNVDAMEQVMREQHNLRLAECATLTAKRNLAQLTLLMEHAVTSIETDIETTDGQLLTKDEICLVAEAGFPDFNRIIDRFLEEAGEAADFFEAPKPNTPEASPPSKARPTATPPG